MPSTLIPNGVVVVGAIAIAMIILLLALVATKARKVDLTAPGEQKPGWMRSTPPAETLAATKADGEGVQLFDRDKGEALASPFAEQIEDIVRAKLKADPLLAKFKIDLGSAPDRRLEISVDGKKYPEIDALPDERLRRVFHEAVAEWEKS